ncbi:MAG TPA: hypothetical protein VHY34_01495 [Caulobacteraceae bacterium]|jgi:hypothetical protein|nr:hypothetical protein [Caulobacteraceae bacterium]
MMITMDDRRAVVFAPPVRKPRRPVIRIWVPMLLFWLLLVPIGILASPLLLLLWLAGRGNIVRLVGAGLYLLAGLSGTQVEVDCPTALIFIRIL